MSPQFITGLDKNIPSKDHNDKPHESNIGISSPILNPTPPRIHHRYSLLKLPQILHDFPPEYYKYIPVFDGEPNTISAEKHIQGFEHFIDLFEIDHDDVCMRVFLQSLKGDTKDWCWSL
jgi:hypothetical protein